MKSEIKIFNNSEFGQVRTINEEGKIMFNATDIAKALGYANPRKAIITHCKSGRGLIRSMGVETGKMMDGTPIMQNVSVRFIDEGDVYRLIVSSKLPKAEVFENGFSTKYFLPFEKQVVTWWREMMNHRKRSWREPCWWHRKR